MAKKGGCHQHPHGAARHQQLSAFPTWGGDLSCHPSWQVKYSHPAHLLLARKTDHVETEEATMQSTRTAAFACTFLGTGEASSVFFQLSVNQSP